ncbi:MAG: response regulator [Proteobacteria bacterium]|nr:response regulator [Pseudomonadota bacterium]
MKPAILIVDDDEVMRQTLSDVFAKKDYEVHTIDTGNEAIEMINKHLIDLVLLDIRLPDMDGIAVLRKIKEIDTDLMVVMMTAYSDVQTAVMAMKAGAYDYINKPFELDELKLSIQKAIETQSLRNEVRRLKRQHENEDSRTQIYGNSPQVQSVRELIQMIAQTPRTSVLIQGESGTGKELATNAIHYSSKRAHRPLIKINCSAIPENLLESELFGYEKGAFTDAKSTKKGLFELASGGTIFLDEIGDMNAYLQSKLLRVLETQSFMRVGGSREIHVDLRFITASNKNLAEMVNDGKFRKDLYYRLKVMVLDIPPLRERREDILLLANLFIEEGNRELGKNIRGISDDAKDLLLNYSWPGNVRELKNVLERAMILSNTESITKETLPIELREQQSAVHATSFNMGESTLEAMESRHISHVLSMVNGNKSKAARSLGISRSTLREKLKKYAIA